MTLKQNSLMHEDTPTQHSQRNNTYKARSTQSFDNVLEMQKKKMLSHWTTKVLLSKPENGPNHRKKKILHFCWSQITCENNVQILQCATKLRNY